MNSAELLELAAEKLRDGSLTISSEATEALAEWLEHEAQEARASSGQVRLSSDIEDFDFAVEVARALTGARRRDE